MNLAINICNFRSIKATELRIKSGVNILIGPNGSGKTSIFLALKFLRDVIFRGAGLAVARGGGARRTFRRGESEISFTVRCALGTRIYRRRKVRYTFTWEIQIAGPGKEEAAVITKERAVITAFVDSKPIDVLVAQITRTNVKKPTFKLTFPSADDVGKDFLSHMSFISSDTKGELLYRTKSKMLTQLRDLKKAHDRSFFPQLAAYDNRLRYLHTAFSNLNEYNILPDVARQSTDQLPFAEMLPDGKNLSEVVYTLEKENFHRLADSQVFDDVYGIDNIYRRQRVIVDQYYQRQFAYNRKTKTSDLRNALAHINRELAAAVRPIESVSAEIDQTNGKRFVLFKAGKYRFYPEEVSDGTIKWLCILVSLYVPFSRIYLLEEPENFLHPWMQQRLVNVMRDQSRSNSTIFLLTTHSATILNVATPDEVIMVKATENGTVASVIQDRDEIDEALAASNFGLGDLWVSGAIGGVPGEHE